MKLAHGTILLIVDGAQMMLLRNDGDTIDPDLAVLENRTRPPLHMHEAVSIIAPKTEFSWVDCATSFTIRSYRVHSKVLMQVLVGAQASAGSIPPR